MTIDDLLLHLYRACFLVLSFTTLIDYLRHRDKVRRDIFLLFFCVAIPTLLRTMTELSGGGGIFSLTVLAQIPLIAQPYLTIRIVRYFRDVPEWIYWGALGGMLVTWALLLLGGLDDAIWPLMIYFAVVNGYAVMALVTGALTSNGVVRNRIQFAAAGSSLLVCALLLGGVNTLFPDAREHTLTPIRLFIIMSALAFYLGFTPPRWLRYTWKHAELRNYLQSIQMSSDRSLGGMLAELYGAATRGMGTGVVLVKAALWDEGSERLILQNTPHHTSAPSDAHLDAMLRQVWVNQKELAIDISRGVTDEERRLLAVLNAETLIIVPITAYDHPLGVLMVALKHTSLFIDGDMRLLAIFAQQMAVQLHYYNMIDMLSRRNESLEQIVNMRTADLRRSNEELKMLAYVASHDLQEPLRTIGSYLQLIEKNYKDKLDDEGREFIEFAVDGASRMKELIQDVLTYSRLETAKQSFTTVDTQKLVDEIIRSLETAINESGAIITTDPLPKIHADRRLIGQLLQNLISNAIKYRSADRTPDVFVGIKETPDHWQFSIRDNGIGIEPQYLEQIFIIFRRLHYREAYQGTGIGLAVCKKAVELHGGRIWAESVYHEGSTFYFTIPR